MDSDFLFTVDAAQILAKLHLAGLQAVGYDMASQFIVNTGIKNDNPKASPEKPGKVTFDLTNATGVYQVGFVSRVKYKNTSQIDSILSDIAALRSKKLGDKLKNGSDEERNAKDSEMTKLRDELMKAFKSIKSDALKKVTVDVGDKKGLSVLDEKNLDMILTDMNALKALKAALEKASTENDFSQGTGRANAIDAVKKDAVKQITSYLQVFAGKDNVTAIEDDNVTVMNVSLKAKDSNYKGLVDSFAIQPMPDNERGKMNAQFSGKEEREENICFAVNYHIDVEK